MAGTVAVRGYRELSAAFAALDKEQKKKLPLVMREVAEPVRRDAETFASQRVRNIDAGDPWARMRTGVTRRLVYVAPKQRGVKGRDRRRRRPNLATLLAERALEPALHRHEADIERALDQALDRLCDEFNRGGSL